jgi:ornithine carbamoyltransferase
MPDVEGVARKNAALSGGRFTTSNSMEDAFKDADIVYPKSWASFAGLDKRTKLYADGNDAGLKALEKEFLTENANHKDWACTEKMMQATRGGKGLYLHCLPADISGVSCDEGEVDASVFDRYRVPLYKQASHKPYIIAAMIFLAKMKYPQKALADLAERNKRRFLGAI